MPDPLASPACARVTGPLPEAPSLVVIGSAETCSQLMTHPQLGEADVLMLDLPDTECGAPLIERLVHQSGVKIVVLAVARDPAQLRDRLAHGPMRTSFPPAANGTESPRGAVMLRRRSPGDPPRAREPLADVARRQEALTAKEREVVRQMVRHRGTKNHAIALELGISEHTLRNHLTVIYSKLGVQGKLNLYVYALEHGLAGTEYSASVPRQIRRWRPGDPDRRTSPAN